MEKKGQLKNKFNVIPIIIGVIITIVGVLFGSLYSNNIIDNKANIKKNCDKIDAIKIEHTKTFEQVKYIQNDVTEIKEDVKRLLEKD